MPIGFVATRGMNPTQISTTSRQQMTRSPHFSRAAISSLKIIIPNWYINSSLFETGSGSALSVTASIEYPVGVFTQILFSGVASGSVPDNGQLTSDEVFVTIPDDTLFFVRIFSESTTGIIYNGSNGSLALGMGLERAVSGLTDKTMGGAVTGANQFFGPVAIIGETSKPSFLLIGDSIMEGGSDSGSPNEFQDFGPYARLVGQSYGYAKCARSSDVAFRLIASHANRGSLFQYATHFICNYGSNDLFVSGRTSAQLQADLTTIMGYMTSLGNGGTTYLATIGPRNQSSDGWQTLVNQSQSNPTGEINRLAVNAWLRATPPSTNLFDVGTAMESSLNSGLWTPGPSSNYYTDDGIHPTTNMILLLLSSGAVSFDPEFNLEFNPATNILTLDAGADLTTWSAVEGASKGTSSVTFIQEASGVPGRVQYTFAAGRFALNTAHRFTGLLTPTTLNYPHTDIKWFVKNERTGEVKWNTLTFDNHSDQGGQSEVGEAKPFNMVFCSTSALDQFTVGFENFANNQLGCTFTVSNLGVFIVV